MGIVIAIDGPAGAGKSTVARQLAAQLGFVYIDTGAMYRAVALWALRQKLPVTDMHRMEQLAEAASITLHPEANRVSLNGEDITEAIRAPEISEAASQVAAIPGVRRSMVAKQREIAAEANVVMEGRDIGSIVFPEARVKVFLDADSEERTRRRAGQSGESPSAVAIQIDKRDRRDRTRGEAPLTQAPDALYLDSTGLSIEQVVEALLKLVRSRMTNGKSYH
ncbi:MAG: (d)CMP kinase [Acidobacteriota bacterium]|nr:(d)CMP kinase [Acidobacteriota bacterium]